MNDETPMPEPPEVDPAEIGRHFSNYHDKTLKKRSSWEWTYSKLWLIEQGLIGDDRPPDRPRPASLSQPYAPGIPARATRKDEAKERPPRKAVLQCLAEIEPEEYEWLWPGRIPNRTVSLIAGEGGAGKSTLTGALATVVTTGGCWPDRLDERVDDGQVVILTAEENASTDLRPRYDRFGADVSRVHILQSIDAGEGVEDRFSLGRDVPALRAACEQLGRVQLVMIDPVGSYLAGVDSHNDAEVQHALTPLFKFAEDCRLAVVLVAHLTKQSSSDIQSRIQGAAAFVNKSRMVWYYSADPRDPRRRLLSFIKGNAVDKTMTALSVGFVGGVLAWDPEPVDMTARQVAWKLAQQASRGELDGKRGPKAERIGQVAELIRDRLMVQPCKLLDLVEAAERECDADRSLVYKAAKKLNGHVKTFRRGREQWLSWEPHLDLGGTTPEIPE